MNVDITTSKRDEHLINVMSSIMKAISLDNQISDVLPEDNTTLLTDDQRSQLRETMNMLVRMFNE